MLRLIIIDDEEPVRFLIRNIVQYEKYGITVAGEADNGQSGLELCHKLKPDIVFADIRMPGIDGLALLEILKLEQKSIKFVLISGYDEFGYVQHAIRNGASDYILKPIRAASMIETIERLAREIKQEAKDKTEISQIKLELRKIQNGYVQSGSPDADENSCCSPEIRKTIKYIEENYSCDQSMELAAEKVFLSATYFSKLFKKETGMNYIEYLTKTRIKYAKKFLGVPELKICEIAKMTGFSDTSYFIKVFRSHENMGPSEYRGRQQNIRQAL